ETDTTIADYVADLRAPTPSAAAELAVFDYRMTKGMLMGYRDSIERMLSQKLRTARLQVENYQAKLRLFDPAIRLREQRKYVADLQERLEGTMQQCIREKRHTLALLSERMEGVSPLKKLSQGFSYVADAKGRAVTDAGRVQVEDILDIHLLKGRLKARVTEVRCE
ncbi:MAG: exodeoxyribonuclease VII large subunit, partial [Clostridiales bacterium]|nr:exodeoxyribonuclease VII large subunit [Clostridiales bacterium]